MCVVFRCVKSMSASFVCAARKRAIDAAAPESYSTHHVTALGLRYLLTKPAGIHAAASQERQPLLVHLHGAASRGTGDFKEFLHSHSSARCNGAQHGFITARPQCPPRKEWTMPLLRMQLVGLIDELCSMHAVDPARVALSGASMGGDGVWALGALLPHRFCALVPVCAGLHLAAVPTLHRMPVWIWHGEKDTVYPIAHADAMYAALRSVGDPNRLHLTRLQHCVTPATSPHAVAHAAWLDAFAADSDLWRWLREQEA